MSTAELCAGAAIIAVILFFVFFVVICFFAAFSFLYAEEPERAKTTIRQWLEGLLRND